jgi:hypothetical protein
MRVITQGTVFRNLNAPRISTRVWRKLLLACGVVFPLLWIGMDVVASTLLYEGFSYADQTVSELSAYDAPTRTFWLVGSVLYGALAIAFAAGVWQSAGGKRALKAVAGLIAGHAVLGLIVGPFSSMHQREVLAADGATFSDTLHLAIVGVGGIVFLFEAGLASAALGKSFRLYSLVTVLAALVFGFITSSYAADVQANEPTPWVGVYERVSAYGYELWIVVLAVALWRSNDTLGDRGRGEP